MWGILNLMQGDMTFTIHIVSIFFSIYLAVFFLRWWIIKKSASTVYAYITIMLVGIAIRGALELVARYYFLTDMDRFTIFCHSPAWTARLVIQLVAMVLLAAYITRREYDSRKNLGKE